MMTHPKCIRRASTPLRKHKAPDEYPPLSVSRDIKAKRVKYYFIDFEMSRLIKRDSDRQMWVQQGGRNLPPEIERGAEYDPFPVDIYYLGNVYREHVLEVSNSDNYRECFLIFDFKKYANMEFLRPLVESMIREDPESKAI